MIVFIVLFCSSFLILLYTLRDEIIKLNAVVKIWEHYRSTKCYSNLFWFALNPFSKFKFSVHHCVVFTENPTNVSKCFPVALQFCPVDVSQRFVLASSRQVLIITTLSAFLMNKSYITSSCFPDVMPSLVMTSVSDKLVSLYELIGVSP